MNNARLGCGLVVLSGLMAGCSTTAVFEPTAAQNEPPPQPPAQVLRSAPPAEERLTVEQKVSFDRGVAALSDGNGLVAVEVFSGLTRELPGIAALHANLGSAHMLQGDAPAAIAAYQRAIALDAELATPHVRLGVLYRRADRLEEAEAEYKAALEADPRNRLAHLNLGILYDIYLREPARALTHYEQFQSLSDQEDKEVALWITDLKQRL